MQSYECSYSRDQKDYSQNELDFLVYNILLSDV